jgi:hypothetical protein
MYYTPLGLPAFGGTMTQSLTPLDPLLVTIVLATLAIGLPDLALVDPFSVGPEIAIPPFERARKLIWQL